MTRAIAKVSLDRVNKFLHESELLDAYAEKGAAAAPAIFEPEEWFLGFRDAAFAWSAEQEGGFRLRLEGELAFKRGGFNLIVGPTGSGKTSRTSLLLLAGRSR
jgi:ABC-type siderophore export system fused ATPase/permease subunit